MRCIYANICTYTTHHWIIESAMLLHVFLNLKLILMCTTYCNAFLQKIKMIWASGFLKAKPITIEPTQICLLPNMLPIHLCPEMKCIGPISMVSSDGGTPIITVVPQPQIVDSIAAFCKYMSLILDVCQYTGKCAFKTHTHTHINLITKFTWPNLNVDLMF